MKDLRLPKYTNEQREEMWNSLQEGDKIVQIEWNHWTNSYFNKTYDIIKRTPKGSLRLNDGTLLKHFESKFYILNDDIENFLYKNNLEKEIMDMLCKVDSNKKKFKDNLTLENALKIKEILNEIME